MSNDQNQKLENTKVVFGIAQFARDAQLLGITFNIEANCGLDVLTRRICERYACNEWLAKTAATELLRQHHRVKIGTTASSLQK